jgi:phosphoribosylamine--glycine ligase
LTKVVVIGSGAREHALVRALRLGGALPGAEPRALVCIPGNAGIAREVRVAPSGGSAQALAAAAVAERPDLVVVGPEAPLAGGLADELQKHGIPCFGPVAAAARIEASKAFAKEVMREAGVPTAEASAFADPARAREHARARGACVVKVDGLAAGKGVIVCDDADAAGRAVDELSALHPGQELLVEERLSGPELSVIALTDGERVLPLPPARDHKRLLDGDQGPNTGGMGAVSPPRGAPPELIDEVVRTVLEPTVRALAARGAPFRGALYAGLMLTPRGPRVLEFNCRLGDPEAQAILIRLRSDALPLLRAAALGDLRGQSPRWDERTAVAVVLAAQGYPAAPRAGDPIEGLDELAAREGEDLWVLHAGTRAHEGRVVAAGGRVLTVAALGQGAAGARSKAYAALGQLRLQGAQARSDIAAGEG